VLHRGSVREGEGHGVPFRWLALAYHEGLTFLYLNVRVYRQAPRA
jgi:hypothetical protein